MNLHSEQVLFRLNSPKWLGRFLLLAAVSIVMYVLMNKYSLQTMLAHLPPSATAEEKEIVVQSFRAELPTRCAFLPIRLLIGWSTFALALFVSSKSFTPTAPLRLKRIFSLEVLAEGANIGAQVTAYIFLLMRNEPVNATHIVPFSIATVVSADTFGMFSLLNSLNFFTLLYIGILTVGLSEQSGFTRTKSFLIVLLTWSACLLFNIGTIIVLRDTMHLLI
jgi:hypothetical protein